MKRNIIVVFFILSYFIGYTQIKLPSIFSNHMVFQRNQEVPVWGWEEPNTKVTVHFANQVKNTVTDKEGNWMVKLDPMEMNKEGQALTIKGSSTVSFKDILIGEVWLCSGQSNMEWTVGRSLDYKNVRSKSNHPLIRHFKIPRIHSKMKNKDIENVRGNWVLCNQNTVRDFTAAGYFFGKKIHEELDGVPIGLINSTWGGTKIEPWTPPQGFRSVPELKDFTEQVNSWDPSFPEGQKEWNSYMSKLKEWTKETKHSLKGAKEINPPPIYPGPKNENQAPTRIYNGMIAPLIPYGIKGVIWYQGEANGSEGISYFYKMKGLIQGWRELWKQGDFPFYYVQLANYRNAPTNPEGGKEWSKIREAQRKAMEVKNTGMAVIIDIGNPKDIHPKNKQDVGLRLASWALVNDYGKKGEYSGPLYESHTIKGNKVTIKFGHTGKGLMLGKKEGLSPVKTDESGKLNQIAIAGSDKKWFWADATIKGNTVVVSSDKVKEPVAVRYAFSMNPEGCNLYNKDGFPASPFRTDDW